MNASQLTDEDRLIAAVKQFSELLDAGKAPATEDFVAQHADLAAELRPALEGLALVHRVGDASHPQFNHPQPTSSADELQGKPIGDFQIVREIGRGGMGVVYEATQLSLNRRVALKVLPLASGLDEVRLQRFRNEANAAATLHHTNIVPVYAVGSDRGVHFYAMQLIDGITLADLLDSLRQPEDHPQLAETVASGETTKSVRSEPANAQQDTAVKPSTLLNSLSNSKQDQRRSVVKMIHQAALAIDHAHQYGVIHRDIKPANLLLDSAGKIWVADFGLAQVQAEQSNLTRTGDPMGTLRYMSPEQATGRRTELDHRTDVYSLGVTLYELLTLKPAIADGDFHDMLNRVAHAEPPSPRSLTPDLPIELDTIVSKAIAQSPAERYHTAAELAADLQAWLDDKPIKAKPPNVLERLTKWRRRNSGLVAAVSAVLLLATIGLTITSWVIWNQKEQTSDALTRETEQRKLAEERFEQARRAVDTFSRLSETELSHRGNMQDLRKSFLETSMSFYQDFLDERADDSELSSDLLATRDRVRKVVDELRILNSIESLVMIRDQRVTEEIDLSDKRADAMLAAIDTFDTERASLENQFIGGLQDENAELTSLLKQLDRSAQELLSDGQRERLRQLLRQRRLPFTFKSSEVINKLALTTEQVEQIDRIIETTAPNPGPRRSGPGGPGAGGPGGGRPGGGGPSGGGPSGGPENRGPGGRGNGGGRQGPGGKDGPGANGPGRDGPGREGPGFGGPPRFGGPGGGPSHEERMTATRKTVEQILTILTPSQRETWSTLIGEPFEPTDMRPPEKR